MGDKNEFGWRTIRRALISVSDKTGIVDFARELRRLEVEIISTGGTATTLRNAGIEVRDVSAVTGFPEMLDGRVKTLHPKIHGGLLGLRANPEHHAAMQRHGIEPIDMVVVNLYPFEETIARPGVTEAEAVEQIDIGGPAMIRSAAKNWQDVTVVVQPEYYHQLLAEMRDHRNSVSLATRSKLAKEAFQQTARYDTIINRYLAENLGDDKSKEVPALPSQTKLTLSKVANLRYGENPHQKAALYRTSQSSGIANAELLSGKEMSFNNYVDADAAWQLVSDFEKLACAIIKHTNACGVGLGITAEEAYRKALATDPVSAFGGIVACNRAVDSKAARAVVEIFTEVIIAPDYDADAIEILRTKKNLRVLRMVETVMPDQVEYKQITGGMLAQTRDVHQLKPEDLKVVSKRPPREEETQALLFAWTVCKHTKSNAIVYARRDQTVGIGAGQMSRVDSVKIGAMRAQLPLRGCVLASDAFFPFRDGVDEAAKHGISAVIQPGGSVRDEEVIEAANEANLAMVFTGIRHFKH